MCCTDFNLPSFPFQCFGKGLSSHKESVRGDGKTRGRAHKSRRKSPGIQLPLRRMVHKCLRCSGRPGDERVSYMFVFTFKKITTYLSYVTITVCGIFF